MKTVKIPLPELIDAFAERLLSEWGEGAPPTTVLANLRDSVLTVHLFASDAEVAEFRKTLPPDMEIHI